MMQTLAEAYLRNGLGMDTCLDGEKASTDAGRESRKRLGDSLFCLVAEKCPCCKETALHKEDGVVILSRARAEMVEEDARIHVMGAGDGAGGGGGEGESAGEGDVVSQGLTGVGRPTVLAGSAPDGASHGRPVCGAQGAPPLAATPVVHSVVAAHRDCASAALLRSTALLGSAADAASQDAAARDAASCAPGDIDVPTPSWMRRMVLLRDGNRCRCCRRRYLLMAHHVIFRSEGGETHPRNLVSLCALCRARHNEHYAASRIMPR